MTATVHGADLGRWFEELCRLQVEALSSIVDRDRWRLTPEPGLPRQGGVYTFWWTGPKELLRTRRRTIELAGPSGNRIRLRIDDEWLGLATGLPVPLYVGKTAESLQRRVGQHLKLRAKRVLQVSRNSRKQKAPTTSCQLRAGIDHIFPRRRDTRELVLDNIGFSYVLLDGPRHAANRFYLEDLAVGMMRPPLNVDVER